MCKHFELRKLSSTIVCLLFAALSFAQPNKITLSGTIDVNSGETFPYKLVLTESGGVVKGYSLTYSEPNETRALVQGTLDRAGRTLSFKETEIVYAHGFHTKAFMCLIDAHLQYVQGGRGNVLSGPITSVEADRTACTGGTITFSTEGEIQNLFSYHEQADTFISMKRKQKEQPIPAPKKEQEVTSPLATEKVTAGIEKAYDWHSDSVVIDIWDGGNVDGDRVTLQFNGETVLNNYYLVKEKRRLRIPLSRQGVNTLTIIADNEGSDPPNTASLLLTDGATKYSLLAYDARGQRALVKIRRVK